MVGVRFNPVEVAYKTLNGKAVIELYGRADGKQVCVQVNDFEPYFWVLDEGEVKDERIVRVEEHKKSFLGKEVTAKKVFVRMPSDVPLVRGKFKTLEADIPFTRRFLIDRKITPLLSYEAEGEAVKSDYRAEVIAANTVRYVSDDLPKLKVLAVDIETHTRLGKEIVPENDPVIMIAVCGEGLRKVLTWKHFDTKLDYAEVVGSEVELIERFGQIVEDYKPDVITGYFSDGFDMPYLKARADKYKARLNIGLDNTPIRIKKGQIPVAEITGISHVDVFKFVKRIFRTAFASFRLNDIAKELLNDEKADVDIDELFAEWNSHNPDLERFAEYNLQDAKLTYNLCLKLMPNLIELTKLIGLTPAELSRMSFSQLVEWYLIKEAAEFNELVPNRSSFSEERSRRMESYEGGFVYEPTPGLYKDVAVFDFRSLYPTIISSHNISPDTLEYGKDSKDGVLKGFSFTKERKGFISTVIENVINRRQRVKELARKTSDDKTLEARQQALKTIANSIYGYYGFFGARWYNIDCAKAITAYGRHHIQDVIGKAKGEGLQVLYSDSLPYNRRIFVKFYNGDIKLIPIGELYDKHRTSRISTLSLGNNGKVTFKPVARVIRHRYKGKLLEIRTKYGSTVVTPSHSVYSYNPKQNEMRLTDARKLKAGDKLVALTNPQIKETYKEGRIFDLLEYNFGAYYKELLLYSDNRKFPSKKGKCPYCKKIRLLSTHVFLRHQERKESLRKKSGFSWIGGKNAKTRKIPRYWELDEGLAWLLGFYCAEGSVSDVGTKSGRKCLLSFGGQDYATIKCVKRILDQKTAVSTKIIEDYDTRNKKKMFYYRVQCLPIVAIFENAFAAGKGSEHKKVPWFIFSSSEKLRRAFLKGYLDGDGNTAQDRRYATHFIRATTKSKELAMGLDFLFKSISYGQNKWKKEIKYVAWQYRSDKPKVQTLRVQSSKEASGDFCSAEIRDVRIMSNQPYVYDVEVNGTHNFVDAEGMILVHNTDSIFIALNGKKISEVLDFVERINKSLPGIMGLEYEGLYKSGIFVATKGTETGAKKKYALMSESGKMKVRGFEAVRRNLSPIAKETQENVLRMILNGEAKENVADYIKEVIRNLRSKKVATEKVTIKTQITREVKSYDNIPPHVAIAMKMQERGEKVGAGTTVSYVVMEGKSRIRDRAKLPEDVGEGEYDPEYYIAKQVVPAVGRILEVIGYESSQLLEEREQKKLESFFG